MQHKVFRKRFTFYSNARLDTRIHFDARLDTRVRAYANLVAVAILTALTYTLFACLRNRQSIRTVEEQSIDQYHAGFKLNYCNCLRELYSRLAGHLFRRNGKWDMTRLANTQQHLNGLVLHFNGLPTVLFTIAILLYQIVCNIYNSLAGGTQVWEGEEIGEK